MIVMTEIPHTLASLRRLSAYHSHRSRTLPKADDRLQSAKTAELILCMVGLVKQLTEIAREDDDHDWSEVWSSHHD